MSPTKETTIYDIAKALNISPSTVSRGLKDHPAINAVTKQKIADKAKEMHYQHNAFASNLRSKRTKTIGVITPRFYSYFISTVIAGMEEEANKMGYNIIINQSQESSAKEKTSIETMFHSRVDGLMVSLALDTKNLKSIKLLTSKKIPVILYDRVLSETNCPIVMIDNFKAGYDATKHLIEQGCKRIIHYSAGNSCWLYNERFLGYKKAIADYGIEFEPCLLHEDNFTEMKTTAFVDNILKMKKRPDGIFVSNDGAAATTINLLVKNGLHVPNDIAVIGFNNDPVSRIVTPNLSTIQYPGHEIGRTAANTLISLLDGSSVIGLNRIVLNHDLLIRESSNKKKD